MNFSQHFHKTVGSRIFHFRGLAGLGAFSLNRHPNPPPNHPPERSGLPQDESGRPNRDFVPPATPKRSWAILSVPLLSTPKGRALSIFAPLF